MSLAGKASVLAIGTELTTGQITNRNAAWLSEKLVNLGVDVVLHETVADDRLAILGALDRCWETSRLVFVCGGLGPTSDDFTRDVIAEWLNQPLEFHEPSWTKIQARLEKFGVPVAPSNRKQALYPAGAEVLKNSQGTADGFSFRVERDGRAGKMWILPGPPREIEAIWKENAVNETIREALPAHIEPLQLFTWECLEKSEAELGELTEAAIAGSGFRTGYRFHRPYVEVKLWVPQSQVSASGPWIDKLETSIGAWVITRNGEDLATQVMCLLQRAEEIDIVDACSGGFLVERLGPALRTSAARDLASRVTLGTEWESPRSPADWMEQVLSQADDEAVTLAIAGLTPDGEWAVGLKEGGRVHQETLRSPWRGAESIERFRTFAVETALKHWRTWLTQSMN